MAEEQRKVYQRQPARAVLVDLSPPLDTVTCLNIHESLSSTLSIILQHIGAPSLTYLSLTILGTFPKCLLPMQSVRSSPQRVSAALKSLLQETQHATASPVTESCMIGGLQEVLQQFTRLSQNTKQMQGLPSQVEVTLLTVREEEEVRKMLLRASEHISLDQLRKMCVVCVSDPDRVAQPREEKDGEASLGLNCSQFDLGLSMMDVIHTTNDVLTLSNIFRQWLLDSSTDSHHLLLTLPCQLGDPPLSIKCDLQEKVIDPRALPILGDKFALNIGTSPLRPATKVSGAALYPQLPVYRLRAEALIEPEGVCESVLYGQPLTLRPTACWRLDWEELERNQQLFLALCHSLQNKGVYLLTVAEDSELNPRFLVLPSPPPSLSLMIKSIAVKELMLPQEVPLSNEQSSPQASCAVEQCLNTLELKPSYNPLTVSSNLYQSLAVNKRGSLSKGHRAFSGTLPQQGAGVYSLDGGNETRSLGPRKQHSRGRPYYSGK